MPLAQENGWYQKAIFYELYVDKFAGTFRDLADHLDYLNFLGVNCLHVLPFMPSPMVDDGYDVSDFRNIRPELGTLGDFELFVKKAHETGIRVMIDLVLNHVSTSHPWFVEAAKSSDNPKRDYFLWSNTGKEFPEAVNAFKHLTPNNWVYNAETGDYYYATFYSVQADLNWDNPRVLNEMTEIMDFWVSRGVDAFRIDAAPYLIKREGTDCRSLPETHAVLKKIRAHVEAHYPSIALIAEVHQPLDVIKQYFGAGDECHMCYHFPLAEQIFLDMERKDSQSARDMAEASRDIPGNCSWVTFLRNHDEISLATLTHAERAELIPFLDPDSAFEFNGESGVATRLASIFHGEREKIAEAFAFLFSLPGSPVIYYGDEVGILNDPVREGVHDTRKYVRGAFDWDKARREQDDPDSLLMRVVRMIAERKK